ncbi:uncharacterized protein LOC124615792 isoform X1 [Schistocerca americana]|uniref:uncharacterized protein LOC124615792 isoform X1 n=1 Tax=Schistocerca americana TaxID=7009 RepID=UPI001F502635|nr:uncharacterized protein LOC124615792 isoform X1 [Schistocerca americana]
MMLRRLVSQTRRLFALEPVVNFAPSSYKICRYFCEHRNNSVEDSKKQNEETQISGAFAGKYRIFRDEDSPIILDVQEERLISDGVAQDIETHEDFDEFYGLSLARRILEQILSSNIMMHLEQNDISMPTGKYSGNTGLEKQTCAFQPPRSHGSRQPGGVTGVFEIEELVSILRRENMLDIFVVSVPPEIKYVNYMVIVTGKSPRHMYATAEFVRRVFKKKRHPHDRIPEIEGKDSKDWIAMDLGNIALHIFSKTARLTYDLESLWSVGAEYDRLSNKKDDPVVELLLQHSVFLGDIKPSETKG